MKLSIAFFITLIFLTSCSKTPHVKFDNLPKTSLVRNDFNNLPNIGQENFNVVLNSFIKSCKAKQTVKLYKQLCVDARKTKNAEKFILENFVPYKIVPLKEGSTILTGYYEAQLKGSLKKEAPYIYPIYKTPNDLININLSSAYPTLKDYRLRGRKDGGKIVAYFDREEINRKELDAEVICYTDSKIDLFFLEVQGSGRVKLTNGETIFIGFDNQNGHKYSSIGKYLIKLGEICKDEISLQTIREWFRKNPTRVDEILNYNRSMVFFQQTKKPATGSLGVVLTPNRSVAVDKNYIPLGAMLFLDAKIANKQVSQIVMAQDTGGAIKGSVRADMFLGYGEEAQQIAGELISPLKLWIFLPKDIKQKRNI